MVNYIDYGRAAAAERPLLAKYSASGELRLGESFEGEFRQSNKLDRVDY
jgi:hypothetical protein